MITIIQISFGCRALVDDENGGPVNLLRGALELQECHPASPLTPKLTGQEISGKTEVSSQYVVLRLQLIVYSYSY